ncbi:hypothetical protein KC352_g9728 [Hortaea werneckii]|uniref:Glycoside hydrolase family 92 protein n=2 Tax=Hortaea werneckii TaxID=91943 RepID=A0A3M7F0J6_HORWE|nr:hypothetical protein KC323_g7813 [Hortaea werneckii]KAI7262561.1 hypothetical protein KC352_g9728 [Hortaea werneckii]KAI7346246.1 hypothetical protein KC320_g7981 [Hortaea werneckii]KAI7620198.1 hypothetical protein KC346_g4237 [Hortaea werneckii]KAI7712561.1 hypothetical protein KC322_g3756 [Hortaea werneckii]
MSDYSSSRLLRSGLVTLTILTLVGLNFFLEFPANSMRQLLPYLPALATAPALSKAFHEDVGVLRYVNPKIGTYGVTPNGNGGMIPSVSVPFGMTRWTPQTRENFISQCPYNDLDTHIHGFQATHQPAIWMGESGQVVVNPGVGDVKSQFTQRGHSFRKENEVSTPYVYEVTLDAETVNAGYNLTESIYSPVPGGGQPVPSDVREGANGRIRRDAKSHEEVIDIPSPHPNTRHFGTEAGDSGIIGVALTATSHVGFLRFDFSETCSGYNDEVSGRAPYVFMQATRQNWTGSISIDPDKREVSGNNPQRQDYALGPSRAPGFSGYFVSRFSEPFNAYGITHKDQTLHGSNSGNGEDLGAYVTFTNATKQVEVRTAVSFVSLEQARRNLDFEVPDDTTFQQVVETVKQAWLDNLGRVTIEGVNETDAEHDPRTVWYTGLFHALQYPNDFSEPLTRDATRKTVYSGYTDSVHTSNDSYYQSWSIWDTYRAEHSLLTLFAPERVNSMMRSLLRIYEWTGWLPMWANIVETNIMIGTHVDAVFANALERGFRSFNISQAWEAVKKNAFTPPVNDTALLYYDREPYTPDEVRAGLTHYLDHGYVPNDRWAESASRTLDYAFDDYAAAVVAEYAGDEIATKKLRHRSQNYHKIFNTKTGFMEAKNANGTWAGSEQGWTEGDDWVYTFNVMHDAEGLAEMIGGPAKLKARLDEHFQGGHNDHTNEPSHHVPYLYAALGYPASTQNLTRAIAATDYNATSAGLSGNEDLGQMSAWYVFSALGLYPVNPASDEYIVGAPCFEKVTIRLPAGAGTGGEGGQECELVITAPGAAKMPFVKSLHVDGKAVDQPVLTHGQIVSARHIAFEMADTPQSWGTRDSWNSA